MADINTLVPDILALFASEKEFSGENIVTFGHKLGKQIAARVSNKSDVPSLRMSNLGSRCERQLWGKINTPELVETLPPQTYLKFTYGAILEELLLFLAKEAGHDVSREQEEVTLNGVLGHLDAVIDGVLVDVKSASTAAFNKFSEGLRPDRDDFGYLTQLDIYLQSTGLPVGGFLAIDKTLGNICLDLHARSDIDYAELIDRKRGMLAGNRPDRAFQAEADGQSGNEKLGVACSYCPLKHSCWPNLRTFLYANGPHYLTTVRRLPNVPEV